jgi:hypothetical protein
MDFLCNGLQHLCWAETAFEVIRALRTFLMKLTAVPLAAA